MTGSLPWIIGAVFWLLWFIFWEVLAIAHPQNHVTLSRFIATMGAKFPFFIFIMGFIVGVLSAHFFWAWPANPIAGGG